MVTPPRTRVPSRTITSTCARSKTSVLDAFYSVALLLPTNNSAGQDAGNLSAPHSQPITLNCQGILLIQQAGRFLRRHQILSFFVGDFSDQSTNGRAIDVHVQWRKKDADQRLR